MKHKLKISMFAVLASLALALGFRSADKWPAQQPAPHSVSPAEHVIVQCVKSGLNAVSLPCDRDDVDLETLSITCSRAPGDVQILGLVVPRERPLHWRVFSPVSGEAEFRISFVRRNRP